MKIATLLGLYLALLVSGISAQDATERIKRAAVIRDAVEKAAAEGTLRIRGVRYDLRLFDGKLIDKDERSFTVASKKAISRIPYKDVIELEVKGALFSFFPNPKEKPFGEWADVRNLVHGDSLDIDLVGKKQVFGVLLKSTDSDLTIMQGNETLVLPREKIARILLARRDTPEAKKILKGAGKGAAAGSKGGGGGSSPGAAIVAVAVLAASATAGAVTAAAQRWPNDRLLIYSR